MASTPQHKDTAAPMRLVLMRIWAIIGLAIIGLGALQLLGILSSAVLFLAVGSILAFVSSPLVNLLVRRRVPRALASMISLVAVLVVVALVFILCVPIVMGQLVDLLSDIPSQVSQLGTWFSEIQQRFDAVRNLSEYVDIASLISSLQDSFNQIARELLVGIRDGIVPLVNNVASTLFTIFLGLVLAYWLTCDYPKINEEICRALGEEKASDYRLMLAVVSQSVGGYLRSMLLSAAVRAILSYIGFLLAGHPYAGAMALLSGVLSFIPVVGPALSAALATVTGAFFGVAVGFWTLVAAVVSQNITDNIIAPKITESTMSVHPALSLTALMIGSALGGTMGMVIAIPLAAMAKSLFIFYYEGRTGRQIVSYDGAIFKGTPYRDASGSPVPAYDALGNDRFVIESELVTEDDVPSATAAPKPQQEENPWDRVMKLLAREDEEGAGNTGATYRDDANPGDDDGR